MRVQVMNRSLSGKEEGSSSGVIAERKSLFKDLRLEERTRLEIDIDWWNVISTRCTDCDTSVTLTEGVTGGVGSPVLEYGVTDHDT